MYEGNRFLVREEAEVVFRQVFIDAHDLGQLIIFGYEVIFLELGRAQREAGRAFEEKPVLAIYVFLGRCLRAVEHLREDNAQTPHIGALVIVFFG